MVLSTQQIRSSVAHLSKRSGDVHGGMEPPSYLPTPRRRHDFFCRKAHCFWSFLGKFKHIVVFNLFALFASSIIVVTRKLICIKQL
jgi:hypothetical protein